ncbi:potassium-transporting ATPase subunit KdpC [Methylicorpusculum oleiharenae]|uniref:potassium-transporting ATPase subunit KdpC n=1 Tax=Methylicorpusculum oleiharenae TaxID=1338687 RepID=UPI00135CCD11|nr:potassium-transporting ATPase subunit KdpC [Methylicorpusculum oleiharenae]MCD2449339.1 potassium-transporting ATPase subunit KdpC [Methylicorpusculum oleiharenae]
MSTYLKPAAMLLMILTLITGVIYPGVVTVLAQLMFADQANGSLIVDEQGHAKGSALIGQPFTATRYFWGRPSATGPQPYNAEASAGSNLGPTNPALIHAVSARIKALQAAYPTNNAPVPVDLVTASASGLDPHISIAAAEYQINRIAKARQIDAVKLRELVDEFTESRQWQVFGEPRVHVLRLNVALDELKRKSGQ